MERIEKPKRAKATNSRLPPIGIRLTAEERAELQAGADQVAGGNLGLYIRTLALKTHRRPPFAMLSVVELAAAAKKESGKD